MNVSGGVKTHSPSTLADVLDRILDKGVVVAGDVSVSLVGVELLTIRLRLLIASVDKAKEMGIGWWEEDHFLRGAEQASQTTLARENEDLKARLEAMEAQLAKLAAPSARAEPVPDFVSSEVSALSPDDQPDGSAPLGGKGMITRRF